MISGFEKTLNPIHYAFEKKDHQIGYLIYFEEREELYFQDAQQKIHEMSKVFFISDEWNLLDGNKNLPKPYVVTESGEVKQFGATLLYSFINSANSNIVVFGQVINIAYKTPTGKLNFNTQDIEQLNEKHLVRNNDNRYYEVSEDGKGNLVVILKGKAENGNVVIKIDGNNEQENGNFKLELNGKFYLNQVNNSGEVYSQLFFDNTAGNERVKLIDKHKNKIEINKVGTIVETKTIRIGKDETLKKIIADLITAILNMTQPTAAGGPTMPTKFNQAEFIAITNRLNQFMDVQ